jgi:glycosyltransferase involved in cell wall biosynthesis
MQIISVTRILNEDDIVEAFVRHNSRHAAHMVFLDNGSTDRTLAILKSLKDEGFPLSVFQGYSVNFDEVLVNSLLYQLASQIHKADWIVYLDADEFIATDGKNSLEAIFSRHGAEDKAISVPLIRYVQIDDKDKTELIVPVRIRWRVPPPTNVFKLFIRGGLGDGIVIDAGNHGGFLDGRKLAAQVEPAIALAHYPRRNGWQNLHKIALGWVKALAAGEAATSRGWSSHYQSAFETLRDKPGELLGNPVYLNQEMALSCAEEVPLAYLGGSLRYTEQTDPALKAFQLGLRFTEQLARQHGRLLDQSPEARRLVKTWNAERRFLF